MDVVIKSFNRPYFLDKCIFSIVTYMKNYHEIIVLDDGTPPTYLEKLQVKYPFIKIIKSEFYQQKANMIEKGEIDKSKLKFPGDFWFRECKKTHGEYFLLLEDDMYITDFLDLKDVETFLIKENLQLFKMLWLGSPLLNAGTVKNKNGLQILYPRISVNLFHYKLITQNKYKYLSILRRLKLIKDVFKDKMLNFYSIYIVAGGIYNKKYFTYIWEGIDQLNEYEQIERTLTYYSKNKIPLRVGKSVKEIIKTSFSSSATNEFDSVNFSIFDFNRHLNEKWMHGELNLIEDFPADLSEKQLNEFFETHTVNNWKLWKKEFTKGYLNFQCQIG